MPPNPPFWGDFRATPSSKSPKMGDFGGGLDSNLDFSDNLSEAIVMRLLQEWQETTH
ncbi:MAG: hypothetical protein KME11_21865 [Timaviella obliquedivisa GSE-PSE-MK23-08B]|nr:hypothetical protein [Timaviella obliquedivisa GSE-PSE-MK23-08B]